MQIGKRVIIWLGETVVETALLIFLFGALLSSEVGLMNAAVGAAIAVPLLLAMSGYYLVRSLTIVAWEIRKPWLHPLITTIVFVGHMCYVAGTATGGFTPLAHSTMLKFSIGGACIVFGCANFGDRLLSKWERGLGLLPTTERRYGMDQE